ncbi:MAG: hypothetical protein LBH46_02575 [Rickettsiales bacterium]|jgi:hypothetical protein|nr:hypothetical protein [Rickettsiales bacterium]
MQATQSRTGAKEPQQQPRRTTISLLLRRTGIKPAIIAPKPVAEINSFFPVGAESAARTTSRTPAIQATQSRTAIGAEEQQHRTFSLLPRRTERPIIVPKPVVPAKQETPAATVATAEPKTPPVATAEKDWKSAVAGSGDLRRGVQPQSPHQTRERGERGRGGEDSRRQPLTRERKHD